MSLKPKKIIVALVLLTVLTGVGFTIKYFDLSKKELPIYGKVAPFRLINLNENAVSLDDLLRKVWVVDFIFTSCPGPCPLMTSKMRQLQKVYASNNKIKFVSISIDPENDTPVVLQEYAKKFSADTKQWFFLTGKRAVIESLAQDSFKLAAGGANPNLHTTKFVLVDQNGQIRGYYDSQDNEFFNEIRFDIDTILN